QVALADGSVRSLSARMNAGTWAAALVPAGGEVLSHDWYTAQPLPSVRRKLHPWRCSDAIHGVRLRLAQVREPRRLPAPAAGSGGLRSGAGEGVRSGALQRAAVARWARDLPASGLQAERGQCRT